MAVPRRPPLRTALLYVLAFIALTVPLTWLWDVWGREAYGVFFRQVAGPIYGLLGAKAVPAPARERYINYIPFLALMMLTPGFSAKRRLAWTAVGVVVLFASHVALNLMAASSRYRGMLPAPLALLSDTMPFLLWAVIARDFVLGFAQREPRESADARPPPPLGSGEEPREGQPRARPPPRRQESGAEGASETGSTDPGRGR